MEQEIIHYPNLRTVMIVEEIIRKSETVVSKSELKRKLPAQIMHQTLNLILKYLEESGKIYVGKKGITWIYNNNPRLNFLLKRAVRVS